MQRFVVTGAPGTGKTTLVDSLNHLGEVVGEPARELIAEHQAATGEESLDGSPGLFIERLIARSIEKFDLALSAGIVIYDRGLPDCVAYARTFGVDPAAALDAARKRRYVSPVFVTPPWDAIYTNDDMRRASFDMVEAFHGDVVRAYEALGYDIVELPKASVAERVAVVSSFLPSDRP